jgi:hypothetical protein
MNVNLYLLLSRCRRASCCGARHLQK